MWIKICGIKDPETALRIAELGPDAIGLNFYSQTPRRVGVDVAATIVEQLPEHVVPVGLFVNHAIQDIEAICSRCGIRTIQLHGDEPPSFPAELTGRTILRAFRVGNNDLNEMADYLEECDRSQCRPDYCLVDARVPGKYGGTGKSVSWKMLAREYRRDDWPPLILSGGLTSTNVADAIRACRPYGVDVSSGVESEPAIKDLDQVRMFIDAARAAFTEIEQNN